MHSQIESDLSNKPIQVASPGLSGIAQIVKEERTFERRVYPRHNQVEIFNVSNIRPVIQLNKEIYHINDRLVSRLVFLNGNNNTLSSIGKKVRCMASLLLPDQTSVTLFNRHPSAAMTFSHSFRSRASYPEGLYTFKVDCGANHFSFNKTFIYSNIKENRIYADIVFDKPVYKSGDLVHAVITVTPLNDFSIEKATFTVVSSINGETQNLFEGPVTETLNLTFLLPLQSSISSSSLFVTMNNRGEIETTSKIIPISSMKELLVVFHPEGGRIGCDVDNRVYYSSVNNLHESVVIDGIVENNRGEVRGVVTNGKDGRGLISQLHCQSEETLTLRVLSPSEFSGKEFMLPACEKVPVLSVTVKDSALHVTVITSNSIRRELEIVVYKMNALLERKQFTLVSKEEFDFSVKQYGVLRVLLRYSNPLESFSLIEYLQERIVFIPPSISPFLTVTTQNSSSVQTNTFDVRQPVTVAVQSTKKGTGFVYVVDKSNIKDLKEFSNQFMIEYLLSGELLTVSSTVKHFLIDKDETEMDLVMGCQSWRRFIHDDPNHPFKELLDRISGSIQYRNAKYSTHLYRHPRMAVFNGRMEPKAVMMDRAFMEAETVAEEEVEEIAVENAPVLMKARAAGIREKRLPPTIVLPWNGPRVLDESQSLFWKDELMITNLTTVTISPMSHPSTYLLYTNVITDEGDIEEVVKEITVSKSFEFDVKTPYVLTLYDRDRSFVPLNIFNNKKESITVSFNCSVLQDGWQVRCPMNYAVPPLSQNRSYITLEVPTNKIHQFDYEQSPSRENRRFSRNIRKKSVFSFDSPLRNFSPLRTQLTVALMNETGGMNQADTRRIPLEIESTLFPVQDTQLVHIKGENSSVHYEFVITLPQENPQLTVLSVTSINQMNSLLRYSLEGLIREPHGCFEQTSSTLYPMLLASNLLKRNSDFIKQGVERLLSFEVKGGGFSLFGRAPASASLTAYGILEFRTIVDYLKNRDSDPELLKLVEDALFRAENWIMSGSSNQASWCQQTSMDSIGRSSCETTIAYIYYSLSKRDMSSEIITSILNLHTQILQKPDYFSTYVIALECLTMFNLQEKDKAASLIELLLPRQTKEGSFLNGRETITKSGEEGVLVETTALSAMCLHYHNALYSQQLARASLYLLNHQKNGYFATTQGTILSLQFLQQYFANEMMSVKATILGKNQTIMKLPHFTSVSSEQVKELTQFSQLTVQLDITHPSSDMFFAVDIKSAVSIPPTSSTTLSMEWVLNQDVMQEGDVITKKVRIQNRGNDMFMMTAVIGIPAGVDLQMDHFIRLKERGEIAFFEIRGKSLIVYWESVPNGFTFEMDIPMIASMPGTYHAAASYVYEYYDKDNVFWIKGLDLVVNNRV